jgi:histidinol-phosphate aminotransferase
MLKARDAVRSLKEYHPPLGDRAGLRLDFNENTVGASPLVLRRLQQLTLEDLARYPVREPVEAQVAEFLGLHPEEVLLTNGVDEGIHLLCETYLESAEEAGIDGADVNEAIIVVPAFAMYEINAFATGARVVRVLALEDFSFPVERVLAAITSQTRLIAVANPNNPTGTIASAGDLKRIANAAPRAAVLVDEAYFEFCGQTVLTSIRNLPNVFVARTFSKAYGLAGLRVGVLAGHADQMRMVRRVCSPYNVNTVALIALPEALADREYVRQYVGEVQRGRERLELEFHNRNITYCPSEANFVLARIGPQHTAFVAAMKQRGILVRDRSSDPGCQGWVRITLGSEAQTETLLSALNEVLAEVKTAPEVVA